MTINSIWQILWRLKKALELHETTPIHSSPFIACSGMESYHPVFLNVYCPVLPSSSSPHFFILTFLSVLSLGLKIPILFLDPNLSFFECIPLIWSSGSVGNSGTKRGESVCYLVTPGSFLYLDPLFISTVMQEPTSHQSNLYEIPRLIWK